jgi:hypothetical protein
MQTFISTFLHGRGRLNRSLSMLGTLALVSISKPLAAQTVATNDGRITGVAVDSIHGGYLRDALVMLSNSSRTTVTDSAGRFRIDSVKPGSYTLTLSHPLLDTMGIRVMTNPFQVTPDQVASFVLAVPSANTAVATKCSAADRKFGDGALTGVVADADSEMPSSGAEVIVAWTDYVLDRQSVSTTPQRRMATVNSDGSFIVCGIPTDLATGVIARRGSDSTAAVPVTFANVSLFNPSTCLLAP